MCCDTGLGYRAFKSSNTCFDDSCVLYEMKECILCLGSISPRPPHIGDCFPKHVVHQGWVPWEKNKYHVSNIPDLRGN